MRFWLDTCLELVAPIQTRRAQGLDLGLARGPQFPPEEVSRAPVLLFVSSTRVDQAGAMFGWAWLEASCVEAIKPCLNQLRRAEGLALGLARGPQFPLNA